MDEVIRVSLAFVSYPKGAYGVFARGVGSRAWDVPGLSFPFDKADYLPLLAAYDRAEEEQPSRGRAGTADLLTHRKALTAALREIARYIEFRSTTVGMLLASGFLAVNSNRARAILPVPTIKRITYQVSGTGCVTVSANSNARNHDVEVAEVDENGTIGPFRPAVTSSSSINIPITDLIPGRTYAFRARSFGGTTGYTAWSAPMTHRAM